MIGTGDRKVHRSQAPAAPRQWKQLKTHKYRVEFEAAMSREYSTPVPNNARDEVKNSERNGQDVVPVMWVSTYRVRRQ